MHFPRYRAGHAAGWDHLYGKRGAHALHRFDLTLLQLPYTALDKGCVMPLSYSDRFMGEHAADNLKADVRVEEHLDGESISEHVAPKSHGLSLLIPEGQEFI